MTDFDKEAAQRDLSLISGDVAPDEMTLQANHRCKYVHLPAALDALEKAERDLSSVRSAASESHEAAERSLVLLKERTEERDIARERATERVNLVVRTIGGTCYEGTPTGPHNFLQRLRILLEKEQENAKLRAEVERLRGLVHDMHVSMPADGSLHKNFAERVKEATDA